METRISGQEKGDQSLLVLNPVAVRKFTPMMQVKRLENLKNKKIGLYWNYKARGDVALNRVKELMSQRYEGMTFDWFETGPVQKATEEWFEHVRRSGVDGVVGTTGD
jgi:hypothetical protein